MTISYRHAEVRPPKIAREINAWASVWVDLLAVRQTLHCRNEIPSTPENMYTRRGMLDGAIIAYGRAFVDGLRFTLAKVDELIHDMGPDAVTLHQDALGWRHGHVAHRGANDWEKSTAHLLWVEPGNQPPTIRLQVVTSLGPNDQFADRLMNHADALGVRVWEKKLVRLKDRYFAKKDARALEVIRTHGAAPGEPTGVNVEGALGVTLNL